MREVLLRAAAKTTKTMVVAADEGREIENLLKADWSAIHSFSWYLHRSLTKKILVLERLKNRDASSSRRTPR